MLYRVLCTKCYFCILCHGEEYNLCKPFASGSDGNIIEIYAIDIPREEIVCSYAMIYPITCPRGENMHLTCPARRNPDQKKWTTAEKSRTMDGGLVHFLPSAGLRGGGFGWVYAHNHTSGLGRAHKGWLAQVWGGRDREEGRAIVPFTQVLLRCRIKTGNVRI